MKWQEYDSRQSLLGAGLAERLARQPYLPLSLLAHAVLLALLYYFGSYQTRMLQQETVVAESLRATHLASTARRVQDLETIKRLLEKSADRVELESSGPIPPQPETPDEMVERARELSQAIEALDQEIRAEEIAELSGEDMPPEADLPPAADPPTDVEPPPDGALPSEAAPLSAGAPPPMDAPSTEAPAAEANATLNTAPEPGDTPLTAEQAASEVAALEAKARDTLARRQVRLEAKANGVPVEGAKTVSGAGDNSNSVVRAQIADFIGSGEYPGAVAGLYSGGGSASDITGSGYIEVPPVDSSTLVRGHGRMVGPGGEYANRLYVDSWYIIGPFQGGSRGRLRGNPVYPPERAVLLDAVYLGKDGRLLKWRYVSSQRYPLIPPDLAEDAVYYGYTEVSVDEDCDLLAWFGADDDAQVYVNDRVAWPGGSVTLMRYLHAIWGTGATHLRDYNLTEGQRVVHFNKGRNKIFFKLTNGAQGTHLSFILTRQQV